MPLVIDHLTVMRGERAIIRHLSLTIADGAALLLTGANGVGKTTLLRTIAGLLPPAAGSIHLNVHDTSTPERDEHVAEHCHFIGHLNGIKPSLTVAENASFWAAYLGGAADRVAPALDQFRLSDLAAVPAGYLSAGQKRRLGLARLLLAPRPLWLLDEPAVSLDASSQRLLAAAIDGHTAAGGIVIAATHQPLGLARSREHRLVRAPEDAAADAGAVDA